MKLRSQHAPRETDENDEKLGHCRLWRRSVSNTLLAADRSRELALYKFASAENGDANLRLQGTVVQRWLHGTAPVALAWNWTRVFVLTYSQCTFFVRKSIQTCFRPGHYVAVHWMQRPLTATSVSSTLMKVWFCSDWFKFPLHRMWWWCSFIYYYFQYTSPVSEELNVPFMY
jgi:hypothetical protein